jgi:hypothetical protein
LLRKTCLSGISCTTLALTSPEVKVEYFSFATRGSTAGDNAQPIVNILVSGTVQITTAQSTRFNFQTSVAQRIYDQ